MFWLCKPNEVLVLPKPNQSLTKTIKIITENLILLQNMNPSLQVKVLEQPTET